VLTKLSKEDHRLIVLNSPVSEGACAARNRAIEHASGYFITGLDDDDEFSPDRIESFLKHYDEKYSFICDYRFLVDPVRQSKIKELSKRKIIDFEAIKRANEVGNQVFIEKSKLDQQHRYDTNMPSWQDYELWFRLIRDYGPALKLDMHTYYLDSVSADDRITDSNDSKQGLKCFVKKHSGYLSKADMASLTISDLFNRQVRISLPKTIILCRNLYCLRKGLSLYLMTHSPKIHDLIVRLVNRIFL
jgi:glycosyltransferase involved in cell wall biosynthesis